MTNKRRSRYRILGGLVKRVGLSHRKLQDFDRRHLRHQLHWKVSSTTTTAVTTFHLHKGLLRSSITSRNTIENEDRYACNQSTDVPPKKMPPWGGAQGRTAPGIAGSLPNLMNQC